MIEEIENITLQEMFLLPNDKLISYYRLLRFLNTKNIYNNIKIDSILMLPFKDIVQIKKLAAVQTYQSITAMFEGVFNISSKKQARIKILDYFPCLNFILNGIEQINELEATRLASEPKEDLIIAGVEILNQYGVLTTIDALAGGDILKWREIECMPWQLVFTKLCMDKDKAEIQDNYVEIIKNKNK